MDKNYRNIKDLSAKCMEIMTLQVKWHFPFPAGYLVPYSLSGYNQQIPIASILLGEVGIDITFPKKFPQMFTLPTTDIEYVYLFFTVSIQLTYKR
jgi:hypothetical protein